MKWLIFFTLLAPATGLAAAPLSLSQIPTSHIQDPAGIKLTSVGDRTLIAVQAPANDDKGTFWYGVDPGMDAQTSRVVWSSRVACPLASAPGEVLATSSVVLCRTDHDVFALAPQDGSVRWRFHSKKKLAPMATAGQRVAVNLDGEELDVLDLATGRVLRRFALHGAPVQAAALSPNGPLAFIVAKRDDAAAPGHTHEIIAQPLADAASTTDARLEPLAPLWRVPFGGADYRLVPSQSALVSTPVPGVIDARDLATGRVLWADPAPLLPTLEPLADGLAVGGIRPDGVRWVGIADARTRITAWRRAWPLGALHGVGVDNGHVVWLGDGGWLVTRAKDGVLEASGEVPDASEVAGLQAADHVLTVLLWDRKTGGTWQQVALAPTQPPPPLPEAPTLDWLTPGRQLTFLDFGHGGRDAQTLLPGDGAMQAVLVWPIAAPNGLALQFQRQDAKGAGETGTRTLSEDDLATASRLELNLTGASPGGQTTVLLGRAVWSALLKTGHADLTLDGQALALHTEGLASVRLQLRDAAGAFRWADVDAQVAANEDGTVRLWLMPYGDAAIAARAELPHRTWALMNVDWRPRETPTDKVTQDSKAAAGKKGAKPRKKK